LRRWKYLGELHEINMVSIMLAKAVREKGVNDSGVPLVLVSAAMGEVGPGSLGLTGELGRAAFAHRIARAGANPRRRPCRLGSPRRGGNRDGRGGAGKDRERRRLTRCGSPTLSTSIPLVTSPRRVCSRSPTRGAGLRGPFSSATEDTWRSSVVRGRMRGEN
jgi:hypothetical protein